VRARRVTAVVGALLFAAAVPAQAGPPPNSFSLSGSINGTLSDVSAACGASGSAADVQFSWYGNVTTLTGVSTKSIVGIEVDLAHAGYGHPGHLKRQSLRKPPFVTFSATNANPQILAPIWRSDGGSYSTSAGGANGTIDVKLVETQTRHPHGSLTLDGSWTGCPKAPGT
jgi:hypothetical protein